MKMEDLTCDMVGKLKCYQRNVSSGEMTNFQANVLKPD